MEQKLKGLVLKNIPTGDNKTLVTVLDGKIGKTLITCHGARKLTSRNMPATQPFCLCEFIVSEKNGRFTLKESHLLESFFELRCDLYASALGAYILETGNACAKENENEEALLSLMLNSLYALCKKDLEKPLVKTVYELRLLLELGCEPNVEQCTCCGKALPEAAFYAPSEGGGVCPACKNGGEAQGPFFPLDPACRQALNYILLCAPKKIFHFKLSEKGLSALSKISEESLLYTLERSFESLKFYKELQNIDE
ncbi:MAG: DNA repair protein RecO [Clostridia bacterium]|nr:DNA repair protein RecO [Clostridia bacterium]MBQ8399436.1 DNA repair protein RecO [Clostridia bacterium]